MRGQIQFKDSSKTIHILELESLKDEGRRAIKHGNYNYALNCFNSIIENDPNNVNILYYKLDVLNKKAERKEAIEVLEKIIEIDPSNPDLYIKTGNLLAAIRDSKASVAFLTAFNLSDNMNPEEFFNTHYIKIRYVCSDEQRIDFLNGLLKAKKNIYSINKELISCFFNTKENDKAGFLKDVLNNLINKADKLNLFSDAISELSYKYVEIARVIGLMKDYDFAQANEKEAKLYSDLSMFDKLVEVREELIKRYPVKLKSLAFELGKACFESFQYEKALSYFYKAVEYNIKESRLQEYIGRCHLGLGRIEEGKDILNRERDEKYGEKITPRNFNNFGAYSFYKREYERSVRQYACISHGREYSHPEHQVNTIEAMIIAGQLDEAKSLLNQRPMKGRYNFRFHVWFLGIIVDILQGNTEMTMGSVMDNFSRRYFYRYYVNWSFRRIIEWLHHDECYVDEEKKKLLLKLNYRFERWKKDVDEANYKKLLDYIK